MKGVSKCTNWSTRVTILQSLSLSNLGSSNRTYLRSNVFEFFPRPAKEEGLGQNQANIAIDISNSIVVATTIAREKRRIKDKQLPLLDHNNIIREILSDLPTMQGSVCLYVQIKGLFDLTAITIEFCRRYMTFGTVALLRREANQRENLSGRRQGVNNEFWDFIYDKFTNLEFLEGTKTQIKQEFKNKPTGCRDQEEEKTERGWDCISQVLFIRIQCHCIATNTLNIMKLFEIIHYKFAKKICSSTNIAGTATEFANQNTWTFSKTIFLSEMMLGT